MSDCRSRSCKSYPKLDRLILMKIDRERFSKVIFLIRLMEEGHLSITGKGVCRKYSLTDWAVKLPIKKKCGSRGKLRLLDFPDVSFESDG